jgi:hypothetical protein
MPPVEQVTRVVAINDLAICVTVWRWICDDCGRRETFADSPMPEGHSEMDAQRKGWKVRWDAESDGELVRCPGCISRNISLKTSQGEKP